MHMCTSSSSHLDAFVGSSMPLGLYCSAWKNWLCHLCKSLVAAGFRILEHNCSLVDSLLKTILLDNVLNAFRVGCVLRTSLAPLPLACSLLGIPCQMLVVMEVDAITEVLREQLQGTHSHALHCLGAGPSAGVSAALTISGLDLLARVGSTVNYLFLVDAYSAFCSSGLVLTTCLLSLVSFVHRTTCQFASLF